MRILGLAMGVDLRRWGVNISIPNKYIVDIPMIHGFHLSQHDWCNEYTRSGRYLVS